MLAEKIEVAEAGQPKRQGRDRCQCQRALRQLHPVQRHQTHHFGETDGDDDKVGAADAERELADDIAAHSRDQNGDDEAKPDRPRFVDHTNAADQFDIKAERNQRAGVGADPEESDVAKAELSRIAQQQIEAHRRDDEYSGGDKGIEKIGIFEPHRDRRQREQRDAGK